MPTSVRYALLAISASLIIGIAMLIGPGHAALSAFAALLLIGGLLTGVALRRNWARIALTILTILGFVVTLPVLRLQLAYGRLIALGTVAQTVLQFSGVILLFLPSAKAWFGTHASASPAA